MKRLSVKKKLYLMIIVIVIPIIIHQVYGIFKSFQESVEHELKSNEDFAEAVGVSFTNYLERVWDTELAIGQAICDNTILSSDEIGNYMKSLLEGKSTIRDYRCVDPVSMKIIASSSPEAIGVSLEGREYIRKIVNGESKTVSDLIISRVDFKPTFVVARGIRKDDQLKNIVIATVDVAELEGVLPSNRTSGYSFFGLIDKQGIFVYRSGVPDVAAKMINLKDDLNIAPALQGQVVKVKKYLSRVTGKRMIGVNMPIEDIGWVTCANTSYDEVLARTFNNMYSGLILLILIIGICVFISIKIGKRILQPITTLQASALEMSNGNLNVRTNISGYDEIALAAQAFDKMASSIEQYDMLKTQFFSNISHELKTPLNIILASLQMIESKHPDTCACENYRYLSKYIPMMKQNCYRLLRLINNLIDITRIDSGFLKFNFGNYNIVSVVEDTTDSVAHYAETKGIEVIFDTDIEEKIIGCDPEKIERIMLNLLSNSIKFTPSGGSILVSIFDKGNGVSITVKDTGIGIPADKIPIIFERFRQVDSSLQREYEGSGIGLSLVKAMVEAHNGTISIQSEYEQGTEVIIELPLMLMPEENIESKHISDNSGLDKVYKINIEFSDIDN